MWCHPLCLCARDTMCFIYQRRLYTFRKLKNVNLHTAIRAAKLVWLIYLSYSCVYTSYLFSFRLHVSSLNACFFFFSCRLLHTLHNIHSIVVFRSVDDGNDNNISVAVVVATRIDVNGATMFCLYFNYANITAS